MGNFIDKLGRLTAEQADEIAKRAEERRLEQERETAAEMEWLHQKDVAHRAKLEKHMIAVAKRQETLDMAWVAAELLKAADVPKQDWIDEEPEYETQGFWRKKEVFVQRVGRFAFDGWILHEFLNSEEPLLLTPNGEVGLVSSRELLSPQGHAVIEALRNTRDNKHFQKYGFTTMDSYETMQKIKDLDQDPHYSILHHSFRPISQKPTSKTSKKLAFLFATEELKEQRRQEAERLTKKDIQKTLRDGRVSMRHAMEVIRVLNDNTPPDPNRIDLEEHLQKDIAHLLAKNGLEIGSSTEASDVPPGRDRA